MTHTHFDYAVVGSGFGGALMAMVLRRLGRTVLLLERGVHPRFVIGESSTPFANLLLESIANRYDLPLLKDLSEWGSWQRTHPGLPVGLKRGFTFYHHRAGRVLDCNDRSTQLLVAASPNDEVGDTHWYRPAFDHFLVRKAQEMGATYLDRYTVSECAFQRDRWVINNNFTTGFLIDATGARGSIAPKIGVRDSAFDCMPATRAVYAHFRNVRPACRLSPGMPYNPDDAALHHVFERGWIWILRFNNGITSAGAAYTGPRRTWQEMIRDFPAIQEQFADAVPVTQFYESDQLSFRRAAAIGERFALLPSAVGFVDPILSTGFALTLLGIVRLAQGVPDYEALTFRELDAAADLVSALYAKMHSFNEFVSLTKLYFAAMSFTETCWRNGQAQRASGFLLTNDERFNRLRARFCAAARGGQLISEAAVNEAIAPYDLAGLTRPGRQNWYPVTEADLAAGRTRLAQLIATANSAPAFLPH